MRSRSSIGQPLALCASLYQPTQAKQAKVAAARDLWVPAVNHWGGLGRWAFLEVSHMEDAADLIRARLLETVPSAAGH